MIGVVVIVLLILLNGVLSMSETALVSVRKSKLEADAKRGDKTAEALLRMLANPDRFLSMIQIGITLIGIVNGLFSGKAYADSLASLFVRWGMNAGVAAALSPVLIVLAVTYFTIVLGELVPKMIGLNKAERVARIVMRPVQVCAVLATPLVWALSQGTRAVVKLLGVKNEEGKVTEEEIKAMVNEGYEGGEVMAMERDMVENVFVLDNVNVASVMTHRSDYVWLDIAEPREQMMQRVRQSLCSVYPLCSHSSDNVLGVLYLKDFPLLEPSWQQFDPLKRMRAAHFVPESMSLYRALEAFKRTKSEYALVIDEYGTVQGIVTLHDIVEVLVGELSPDEASSQRIVRRSDDSFVVDGQLSFYELLEALDLDLATDDLPYQTVAGLVLDILEHIPAVGEQVEWHGYRMEVVQMDGARIDRLLLTRLPQPAAEA